jgi:hypothetical protein
VDVVEKAFKFQFHDIDDTVKWKWGGRYTTRSMYDHLTRDDEGCPFSHIWKAKIPYKIKIFTWLLENNVVLTKDNMAKRKWDGNKWKQGSIFSFSAPLQNVYGGLWGLVLEPGASLEI